MYLSRENHDSHYIYKKNHVFSAKLDIVELYCCLFLKPQKQNGMHATAGSPNVKVSYALDH